MPRPSPATRWRTTGCSTTRRWPTTPATPPELAAGIQVRPAPLHHGAVRAIGDAGIQDGRRAAHPGRDPRVQAVAAGRVDLARRLRLADRTRRIDRLVGGR